MDNEEAISVLYHLKKCLNDKTFFEALDMAIKALKNEQAKGEWIKLRNMTPKSYQRLCSNCHKISYFCGDGNYPNCPYCLADMRGDKE